MLELVIVLYMQLVTTIGMPATILVLILFAALAVFLCNVAATTLAESFLGPSSFSGGRTRKAGFGEMDDLSLSIWIEKHPKDHRALREHCDRLRRRGELAGCAEGLEELIAMGVKMEIEEACMIHHQLADLYLGPLRRPERGREILQAFVDQFPGTKQAGFTAERLENLTETAS